jgi:hypothetical protein
MFYPKLQSIAEKCYIHHAYSRCSDHDGEGGKPQQLKQSREGFYEFSEGEGVAVNTPKSFAIKSAYDRSQRRAQDSQMFGYESLRKGTEFLFEVETDNDDYEQIIIDRLVGKRQIGRSRTAQYGLVEIIHKEVQFSQPKSTNKMFKKEGKSYAVVYADSRLVFLDENGELTFDAATSVQAFNKLYHASVEGRPIPLGWAIDPDGNDTTDPKLGMQGALLPFGGYKGYGLGFMVHLITGVLSGSSLKRNDDGSIEENIHNCGFNFCAIDINRLIDLKDFFDGEKLFADRVAASPKKENVERIYLPGEIEVEKYQKALSDGVFLDNGVEGNMLKLKERFGL